jgi:hypothetical protein
MEGSMATHGGGEAEATGTAADGGLATNTGIAHTAAAIEAMWRRTSLKLL